MTASCPTCGLKGKHAGGRKCPWAERDGICLLHATSAGHAAGQCSRCDECGHENDVHIEDYLNPTCWAQARCTDCVGRPAEDHAALMLLVAMGHEQGAHELVRLAGCDDCEGFR
jgi:hypothetical protein